MKPRRLLFGIAVAAGAGICAPAWGLGATCTVGNQTLMFGNYDPTSSTPVTVSAQITVTCTALLALGVPYTMLLSAGGSGNVSNRAMSGLSTLKYNLYTSSGYTTVWDNTTGVSGTVNVIGVLTLFSGTDTKTVYGRIPVNQSVKGGTYADTITITVNY
jgi:spore coat protein U-like protein